MAVFSYESLAENGKKHRALIEAGSLTDAKMKLRDQGVLVVKIGAGSRLKSSQHLNDKQLKDFTTMFTQLVTAGIPLYESLIAIEEAVKQEPYHRVILSLAEQVKSGSSLSDAMKTFPESFDRLYTSMIAAAEASGTLDAVLTRLLLYITKRAKIKKEISNALIYPGILAIFALAVIALLMGFVVPSIEGIFEGRRLNGFTEFVLGTSRFLRNTWWIILPLLGSISYGAYRYLKTARGKLSLENLLMRLPIINKVLVEASLVRFARTLSSLLQGGIPLIEALSLSRQVMQNGKLEAEVLAAEQKILAGSSLSAEFRKSKWIPQLATRMFAVGEESGHLSEMVAKVADMYEDELEKTIERVMTLIQPAILVVMGAIIGLVLMAILLPMADISSLTEN